jgi:hypothetical protein
MYGALTRSPFTVFEKLNNFEKLDTKYMNTSIDADMEKKFENIF